MEIIIITGKVNSGKTTLMTKLVKKEKALGNSPTGVIAKGIFKGKAKTGYRVKDLATGRSVRLAGLARPADKTKNKISIGEFVFSNKGLDFAQKAVLNSRPKGIVFLDEVGPLELVGKGYADCLRTLLRSDISRLYMCVRDRCLKQVLKKFFSRKRQGIRFIKTGKVMSLRAADEAISSYGNGTALQ